MSATELFIRRPVATSLLTVAIAVAGIVAFQFLPIASLPQVDYPNINVQASLPGASPETMAATVATPLERTLGRIAGITEMTSSNTQGSTRINLQFDLDRDIDGAARDVQSAINAARSNLPAYLPSNPTYRKANAAGLPIMAIALTSPTRTQEQLYDVAFSVLAQKISQVNGVGQVTVNGASLPAVRIEVDPAALSRLGIGLEQVREAIAAANSHLATGMLDDGKRLLQIRTNGALRKADEFRGLVIARHDGALVRLGDVADVRDALQELRNAGSSGGKPAVMLSVQNQSGANIVETVDAIKALLPALRGAIPGDVDVQVVIDRTTTIRASLREVEHTLLIAVALVVGVVYLFLRNGRATLIPSIAIPVSLLGTLVAMQCLGYSLNNLSLMALIVATSFVVDDAIVVVENVMRHLERGEAPFTAALQGAREVAFTVLSMSLSLIAVFVPILFMGGIVGRLFREFAVTLSVAVGFSLLVALTTTPMLCAQWLRAGGTQGDRGLHRRSAAGLAALLRAYERTLSWALRHPRLILLVLFAAIGLNVHLYGTIPKGFFPQQDTGRLNGFFQGDQSISFQAMRQNIAKLMEIVSRDPAIDTYYEYTGGGGGGQINTGSMFARLKPLSQRDVTAAEVAARLRPQLMRMPGASLFVNAQQDINVGGRPGGAQFQYTLLADSVDTLQQLAPRLREAMSRLPQLADVNSDFQNRGLLTRLVVDRAAAARLGITAELIDATLNDAFAQRLVSPIPETLNQYYAVLTLAAPFTKSPEILKQLYIGSGGDRRIPLSVVAHFETTLAPLAVNHQDQFVAATISFNTAPGVALSDAISAIERAFAALQPPTTVRGTLAGTAQAFRDSLKSQPWLILAALVAVYIVLGMLYESYVHPLTILSTLPSAGVGALLALLACGSEFNVIGLIGVILLIGIVKKNAIMMIDTALALERQRDISTEEAIFEACLLRFRPIMMTTLAAMLGALPLALAAGDGSELRRPLGIAIVGGLLVSQLLTLYTTPVVYLHLDRLRLWCLRRWSWSSKAVVPGESGEAASAPGRS